MNEGIIYFGLLNTLAEIKLVKTEYMEARSIHSQIMQTCSRAKSPFNLAFAQVNIAHIDVIVGAERNEVLRTLDSSRSLFKDVPTGIAYCNLVQADLEVREGNLATAKSVYEQNFRSFYGKDSNIIAFCLERLGDVTKWGPSSLNWTSSWTIVFLAQAVKLHKKREIYQALQYLGDIFRLECDTSAAMSLFALSLHGFSQMDIHRSKGECLERIADIMSEKGDKAGAVKLSTEAHALFEKSLQGNNVSQMDVANTGQNVA